MKIPFKTLIVALAVLGAPGIALRGGSAKPAPGEVTIAVPGIPGPYCMYGIEKRLAELPEVEGVRLLWEEEEIRIAVKPGASISREQIEEAVRRAEYPYEHSIAF